MISGSLNNYGNPIIPVSVKKLNGKWQNLNFLLDTGSELDCMLAEAAAIEHGIAIRPDRDSQATIPLSTLPDDSIPPPPCWVELQIEGNSRVVKTEVKSFRKDEFSGVIGPKLLLSRRITIDVEKCGAVTIDSIPAPTRLDQIRKWIRKPEQPPNFWEWEHNWKLPWMDIAIRDSAARQQPLRVNVDTGDSGQLSLPPSKVEGFGFRLPGRCEVDTPDGPLVTSCGEVEIHWQGELISVQCIQRLEHNPPLIGMKLLRGNRMTIDVDYDYFPPIVEVTRLPGSASLKDRFHRKLAEMPWRST